MSELRKFQCSETGSVVNVDELTAGQLGPTWKPVKPARAAAK